MSTSITSPISVTEPGFTGVSKFASSLQQVLARSVGIASLPLNSLQAGLTTLQTRQSALQYLDANFSSLQLSIGQFQNTLSSGLLTASASDSSIVSATAGSGAAAGSYAIEVEDLGSWSTALSQAGPTVVTDPAKQGITSDLSLSLSVGTPDKPTKIVPASSSLQDLASAINTQSGGQVQATVVNVGSTESPDYRLSLTAANLGTDPINLADSTGTTLISKSIAGTPASYKIDGADSIPSKTRTITLSTGLTVNLIGESDPGKATTITVRNDPSTLASSFNSFVQAYNAAATAISQQHSQNGALQGDNILQSLGDVLSQLSTYTTGSPEGSLANFGIEVDKAGQLSIDTTKFTTAANAGFSTLLSTLGTSTTGGFLKAATDLLSGVEDATIGFLPSEETSGAAQMTNQNTKIANEQAILTQLQANLTAQIANADAAIAQLESKVSFAQALFAQYTGYNPNSSSNGSSL